MPFFVTLTIFCAGLFLALPASACTHHDEGVMPESVDAESALGKFLIATKDLSSQERNEAMRNLPPAERQEIKKQFRALHPDERVSLSMSMTQRKRPLQTKQPVADTAEAETADTSTEESATSETSSKDE